MNMLEAYVEEEKKVRLMQVQESLGVPVPRDMVQANTQVPVKCTRSQTTGVQCDNPISIISRFKATRTTRRRNKVKPSTSGHRGVLDKVQSGRFMLGDGIQTSSKQHGSASNTR